MSLTGRRVQWGKKCFVYCGPERCNCEASIHPAFLEQEREARQRTLDRLAVPPTVDPKDPVTDEGGPCP